MSHVKTRIYIFFIMVRFHCSELFEQNCVPHNWNLFFFCFVKRLFSEITECDFFLFENKCGNRNVLSKRQVWMSIFHIINLKKNNHGHRGPGFFFNKKLILDYYFCLKSGSVFLVQIFIKEYKIVSLIIN